jgi:transcriptional regulator with XRE-family HTH domain
MNKKLIAVRKSRKITQADIATYLKISQTQYQKRETGKIKISDQEWKDIARLLDVSVEEIFEEYPNQYLVLQKKIEILKLELKALSLGKNI